MASLTRFLPRLLLVEGGYYHVPGYSGGETWCGIARAYHPNWPGWPLIELARHRLGLPGPVAPSQWPQLNRALAADAALARQVGDFYQQAYWDALGLDQLCSQAVAEQLADHGVNAGVGRVPRLLRYALRQLGDVGGLAPADESGTGTLRAANAADAPALLRALVELRRQFYRYRAGALDLAAPSPLLAFFTQLRLRPNPGQARHLPGWLARVEALAA